MGSNPETTREMYSSCEQYFLALFFALKLIMYFLFLFKTWHLLIRNVLRKIHSCWTFQKWCRRYYPGIFSCWCVAVCFINYLRRNFQHFFPQCTMFMNTDTGYCYVSTNIRSVPQKSFFYTLDRCWKKVCTLYKNSLNCSVPNNR